MPKSWWRGGASPGGTPLPVQWRNHHSSCFSSCVRRDMLCTIEMKYKRIHPSLRVIHIYSQTQCKTNLKID